jgi:two-component system NtrC family response regulator/two-component system response regulator HydG
LAQRGTLFLDDVADVPLGTQPKLLRLLQWREFERVGGTETLEADVRIIAATNRDLAAEVRAGRFCEELYYRLNVFTVELPPLRRRKGDIPALVAHFIEKHAATNGKVLHGLGPATLKAILAYEWPGNVRELENAIASAVAVCRYGELRFCDLPAALRGGGRNAAGGDLQPASAPADPATARLQDVERDAILRAVALVGGSTARAAEMLGISVRKVQYRMKAYRDSRRGSSKGGGGEPSSDG